MKESETYNPYIRPP